MNFRFEKKSFVSKLSESEKLIHESKMNFELHKKISRNRRSMSMMYFMKEERKRKCMMKSGDIFRETEKNECNGFSIFY